MSQELSKESKSALKTVFLTIFLDLVGFSIIFPLFPALAKYYLQVDPNNYFLNLIFNSIQGFADSTSHYVGAQSHVNSIVLFGGALGALYSLLQFIAAPIWGALSDKIGRRPILLMSISGLALSYFIWIFAGNFTYIILARFIGGIMAGNISTATAVVSDVTSKENRAKGMAIIGVAFALGFVIGPALGGMLSTINLVEKFPEWQSMGINPFSSPAILAFVLTVINLVMVSLVFKESLPKDKRNIESTQRSANVLKIFKPLPFPGVNLTNYAHFLFLTAFSGMEFTLTFLAAERLGYSSMNNAYIFIYIGFILALVQGGIVRRMAHKVGEKKMAMMGLILIIPGLAIIAQAYTSGMFYFGLTFLAIGSSMAIPCLTTLVTFYTPSTEQGRSIGVFRSLGALARVLGPIFASLCYYKYGTGAPYYLGSAFLLIPILMVSKLPKPQHT